jgi:ABC-type transporter MlaC component
MMKSILITAMVSAYLFSNADPQETLKTQYKAYVAVQAFNPGGVEKYRDKVLHKTKKIPRSARTFLSANIDWEAYAESVFRPNWNKLTKRQKRKFKKLLQRDAIQRYGHLFSPDLKFSAKFNNPTDYKLLRGNKFARVRVTLASTRTDAEAEVDFIFRQGLKRWAICDVYIDGVSKSKSYRRAVRRIYKKEGYKGVMKVFEKNLVRKDRV